MLNGHSPITHGNILDVSENIQNGKIRLDNIAPQLIVKFTAGETSNSLFYWEFVFTRDSGSQIANLQEMREFGWLYYTAQIASANPRYKDVISLPYVGFDIKRFSSRSDRIHSDDGVAFQLGFSSDKVEKIMRSVGRSHFFMRVSGISDVAGNELYCGTLRGEIKNDAYLIVKMGDVGLVPSVIDPSSE